MHFGDAILLLDWAYQVSAALWVPSRSRTYEDGEYYRSMCSIRCMSARSRSSICEVLYLICDGTRWAWNPATCQVAYDSAKEKAYVSN